MTKFLNLDNSKLVNVGSIQLIIANYDRNVVELYMPAPINKIDVKPRYNESVTELFDAVARQLGELNNV